VTLVPSVLVSPGVVAALPVSLLVVLGRHPALPPQP
jgi:hypothetical protein